MNLCVAHTRIRIYPPSNSFSETAYVHPINMATVFLFSHCSTSHPHKEFKSKCAFFKYRSVQIKIEEAHDLESYFRSYVAPDIPTNMKFWKIQSGLPSHLSGIVVTSCVSNCSFLNREFLKTFKAKYVSR